jgi:hypothetical protein
MIIPHAEDAFIYCVANTETRTGAKPLLPIPAAPTEFDDQVRRLRLDGEACLRSPELREWCRRHRNQYYVPQWLLKAWGIDVDYVFGPLRAMR